MDYGSNFCSFTDQLVPRPDVVEMHDVTAQDPKLLVFLKVCTTSTTGLLKRFRVAGDGKKVRGGPTKHKTHLTPITASIILILFFTMGCHDFLFSICMNLHDDIIRKSTKYYGNLQIVTYLNLIHFKVRFYIFLSSSF